MKTMGKILRFYIICCVCMLILVWVDNNLIFNSSGMGYGILITFFLGAPIFTIFITLIHLLRINSKILGNVLYEIIVVLIPYLLNACYFYIAYRLADNYFVMSPDGKEMSRKWFLDFGNVDIIIFSLLFILLAIHGKVNIKRKHRR